MALFFRHQAPLPSQDPPPPYTGFGNGIENKGINGSIGSGLTPALQEPNCNTYSYTNGSIGNGHIPNGGRSGQIYSRKWQITVKI